jgi:flavorubredoxin
MADLLDLAPNAVVVGAKVAIAFLEDLVHRPFERMQVKNGDTLDWGNGTRVGICQCAQPALARHHLHL